MIKGIHKYVCKHIIIQKYVKYKSAKKTIMYVQNFDHNHNYDSKVQFLTFMGYVLVHKQMFYTRINLQMFMRFNKIMYFGDLEILVPYISSEFIVIIK